MKWPLHFALAVLLLCLLSCGTPGAPRPPSLNVPQPVNDLTATRQGNKVALSWTEPQKTTDKQNIRHPGKERVCRNLQTPVAVRCVELATLSAIPPAGKNGEPQQRTYEDSLSPELQQQQPSGIAGYAIESLSQRGRSAGLSNQVQVPLAPTLPPPEKVTARLTPDAIEVTATGEQRLAPPPGLKFELHLYRQLQGLNTVVDLGGPASLIEAGGGYVARFADRSFQWDSTYLYRVAEVTIAVLPAQPEVHIQGEFSPPREVTARDVFPPAAPDGLQAVAGGVGQPPFVDLTWTPSSEPDLAGYNVYRHQEDEKPGKINHALAKTPSYRDREVQSGNKYSYSVTAVDLRGNESPKSAEASESVP